MGIFSRAKQAKREIFQTFDKETVAKSFADFIALDESLSALSSEPFTGAVALKAKVDAYLALSDQATELKLISKNIADVPTESAQKACEAMVEKLGPVRVQPGGLAVSRAFGAGHAKLAEHGGKPGVVIHEPSVQRATLSADDDLCLVLASDGVWDNVKRLADLSPDLRTQILQAEQYRAVARHAAEAVVGYALRHAVNEGQQDNTTALVVVLGAQAELALSEHRGGGDG